MAGNYFSHDSNARNDDKILALRMELGALGYGIYFMLLERMREEADYSCTTSYRVLAFDLHEDADNIKRVVEDFGLFEFADDGTKFYSDSFNKRMEQMEAKRKKKSEAGKKGAKAKWEKLQKTHSTNENANNENDKKTSDVIALPKQTHSTANSTDIAPLEQCQSNEQAVNKQNMAKENKVNKNKVNKSKEKETKLNDKDLLNSISQTTPANSVELTKTQQLRNDFELLWKLYPKKQRKEDAFKGYKKAIKDGATNKEIQDGIVNWKKHISIKQLDLEFVPQGGTWFNQRRWQDELDMSPPHHNFGKGRVEQLPDWAKEENTVKEQALDPAKEKALRDRIAKLKTSQGVIT